MKKTFILVFLCATALHLAASSKAPSIFTAHQGTRNASISAMVIKASTGEIVDAYNQDRVLTPASCTKLITTCTSLELLGSDYRFSTYLETNGSIKDSVLNGNLYVRGTGDPTLGSSKVGNRNFMAQWVNALKRKGIRQINGNVIADLSFFDENAANPCWQWEDLGNYYAPGIFSLAYMDNTLNIQLQSGAVGTKAEVIGTTPECPELTFQNTIKCANISYDNSYSHGMPLTTVRRLTGSIPANKGTFNLRGDIPNPGLALVRDFITRMSDSGIGVSGEADYILEKDTLPRTLLHEHKSEPLSVIVRETNITSNNQYAEQLFRFLGSRRGVPATIDQSIGVELDYWQSKGVSFQSAIINDGCGLAHNNAISAHMFVNLLNYMRSSKEWESFYASLPISGTSGTLTSLLRDTPLQGLVHAKSGTLSHVKSYSGYIEMPDGETYIFSVIVNNASCKARVTTNLIGKYLLAVCGFPLDK